MTQGDSGGAVVKVYLRKEKNGSDHYKYVMVGVYVEQMDSKDTITCAKPYYISV